MTLGLLIGFSGELNAQDAADQASAGNAASGSAEESGAETKPERTPEEQAKREKALQQLAQQMRFAPSTERKYAIRRVEKLEDEAERAPFYPILLELAQDDLDATVRETALRTLGELKHQPAEPIFMEALQDEQRDVVRAALSGLRRIEMTESTSALVEFAKREDYEENNQPLSMAIRLLGDRGVQSPAPFFLERAKDERTHGEVRLTLILYFGEAKFEGARDYLRELIQDDQAEVQTRAYAVNSLGKLGNAEDVALLKEQLDDIRSLANRNDRARFSSLKQQLFAALVRLGDDSVNEEILAAARDDDVRVRLRAVKQIGEIGLQEARSLLEYMSEHDPSRTARKEAKQALEKLDGGSGEESDDEDSPEDEDAARAAESTAELAA